MEESDKKMEKISRKINKTWKKIGTLLGFAEEELNEIDSKFLHNASLEMLGRMKMKRNADDFTAIIGALESSEEQEIPAEIMARGPDALKVYLAALEEGESDFNLVRLMVMGQENVGKTCLINSLLGKMFIEEHKITPAIAMTRSLMYDESDHTKWTEKEICHKDEIKDKHENAVAAKIAADLQKVEGLSSSEHTGEEMVTSEILGPSGDRKEKHSSDGVSADEETKQSETNTNDGTSQATASSSTMEDNTQPKRIDASVREKIVQIMKGESIKDNSLRIWDYGGQLIYHSIHRFYLTPESIFVIVFNMVDKLDDYPTVVDSSGKEYKYYMTNLEYLLYFIRSAYTYTKDKVFRTDHLIKFPVFIIVGTHCKSLTESEVKEKMTKVREAIGKQMYKSHVYKTYFAVENTCASSDESFIELKKAILEIKGKMNQPIPHKWLDLLIAIQELSKEKKIVTLPLKQVESMAKNYGILDDKTIDVAITYLSDIGEIMYHPKEVALKDIVVTQPMEIVGYFRTVFTIVTPDQWDAILIDDWEKLEKGVLTKRLLQYLWEQFPIFQNDTDEKMFQYFVNLMNKFGLICQKKKQNTDSDGIAYYVVSHLPPKQYSEDPKDDQGDDKVSIFHDFCGFLPDHLFQLVVTKFIEEFQVAHGLEPKLTYEHVKISVDDHHYVRIAVATINNRRMLKTTIVRKQQPNDPCVVEPIPETCKKVLCFLQKVLEDLCSSARGIQYKMCIPCSYSDKCQGMHNVKNFNKKTVPCGKHLINTERYYRLFGGFGYGGSSYKPFTIEEEKMVKISRKINKSWKKIGAVLGFSEEELNVIERMFSRSRTASLEMLRRLRVKMDADDFTAIIDALELSEQEIPAEILTRGPNAWKVYQAALKEGTSDFNLVRLMVMGQENVGKTCLINSLLGKKFNKEHIITELIAMTRSLMWDEADNTKWRENEIDHKDEIKDKHENALATKAAEDLHKIEVVSSPEYTEASGNEETKRSKTNTNTNDETSQATTLGAPMEGEQSQTKSSKILGPNGDRKRKNSNEASGNEETKRSKTNTSTNDETSQATTSGAPMEEGPIDDQKIKPQDDGEKSQTDSSKTVGPSDQKRKNVNDEASGNEETKQSKTNTNTSTIGETSQATASASQMEDIAKTQRIDAKMKEKIVQIMKGKSTKDNSLRIWDYGGQLIYHSIHRKVHKHYMTNLEYLLYWIRSAYTYAKDDDRYTDDEIDFPVCIIVGTHRNSLSGSEEEIWKQINEKFNRIRNAIENQVYKSHVYPKYFAVENERSSSDENIIELKKVILEIKGKMNRPIPHKWLDLLIAIQELSEENVTLRLDEVKSLARQCGISDDQTIDIAITYLSDVGEIMYHPTEEALKDIVVIQPMEIVEYVKPVFTIVKPEQKAPRLKDDWKKLEKGVLTKSLLEDLWKEIPMFQNDTDKKMFNFFVNLMNKFGLICQKKNNTTDSDAIVYYAVSHLHPTIHSLSPEDDKLCDEVSVFHDFCGFLPDYIFQLVVTKFIEEFQVENGHPALTYEHANVSIDDQHYVRIAVATINHRRMLKTTVVRGRQPNAACVSELIPKRCKKVLSFLQSVLETLCSSSKGIQYKMCIPCTCSEKCQQMHVVENFNKNTVSSGNFEISIKRYCRLFGDANGAVSASQGKQWSLNEVTLLGICKKLGNNWKSMGPHLGVTHEEIDCILINCHHNSEDAKMEMLIMWMNRQPSEVNKMSVLSDALMKENYVQIAETLMGKTPCTSDFLHGSQLILISESLGTNWKQFGVHLGMTWNYMKQLESENRSNILDACMDMLTTWQQKQSVMTNQVALMCQLLEKHGFRDLACKLKSDVDAADLLHDSQLFLISKELGANWKDFGVHLSMKWNYMTQLGSQNQGNTLHACMDMLTTWQKQQSVMTNQVALMCELLEKHEFSEIAEKLKQDSAGDLTD